MSQSYHMTLTMSRVSNSESVQLPQMIAHKVPWVLVRDVKKSGGLTDKHAINAQVAV